VLDKSAASAQGRLLGALAETLPITLIGMAAGLVVAFGLAVLSEIRPMMARTLLPIALVTQTMPLVALTPLLVLLLGRDAAVIIAITVSVTFFPAYVTIAQGLQLVPRAAFDLVRAYGATWTKELRLVAIPSALPWLFAAARLAVPRALLGVMIAEWLATGTGLGNLLNQSRGYLDYGMIWSVALVSVVISIAFYQVVAWLESAVLARLGMLGR
jgi:sulfonate transport system permease protein